MNGFNGPVNGAIEISVQVIQVIHNHGLIAISTEQCDELLVVQTAVDGSLANLETIDVDDWQNGP